MQIKEAGSYLLGGVFAQRSHGAGIAQITVIIQVTILKTTCGIMHNQFKTQKLKHLMLAMGPRDLNSAPYSPPVHCSSHSMTSFQSSELTELPVVENSQLFAQRAHSARYGPLNWSWRARSACCRANATRLPWTQNRQSVGEYSAHAPRD